MSIISNKETALLGLLAEESMHAYKIENVVKQRDMRLWTELSMSSIYKLLRKLEGKAFVRSEIKLAKNNISQKIYSLTLKGRNALKQRVKEIISEPEKLIWQIDLGLSNLKIFDLSEALECFKKYMDKLAEGIDCYKNLEAYLRKEKCPEAAIGMATRPQYLFRAEIEWVKDYLKKLSKGANKNG